MPNYVAHGMLLKVTWQPGWKQSLKRIYTCVCMNYHNIIKWKLKTEKDQGSQQGRSELPPLRFSNLPWLLSYTQLCSPASPLALSVTPNYLPTNSLLPTSSKIAYIFATKILI